MRRNRAVRAAVWATVTGSVTALVGTVLVMAGAGGAAATSCVGPRLSPEQIVTGTARGIGDVPYPPVGGYAVIGRVTAVNRLPAPTASLSPGEVSRPPGGSVPGHDVLVTALAYFIGPSQGRDLRFTVSSSTAGYRFEPGKAYFIPVRNDGGQGGLSICDSITVLPDTGPALEQETTRLITAATAKGVPTARVPTQVREDPGVAPTASADPTSSQTDGVPWPVGLAVATTLAAAAALGIRRRRRTRQQTGAS